MDEKLHKAITILADARVVLAQRETAKGAAEARLEETLAWSDYTNAKAQAEEARATAQAAYEAVCGFALDAFDGENKHPHPAVTIKEYTTLDYDEGKAMEHARQHLPNCIKLDAVAFKKAAPALSLPFVTVGSDHKATVKRDLSEYAT